MPTDAFLGGDDQAQDGGVVYKPLDPLPAEEPKVDLAAIRAKVASEGPDLAAIRAKVKADEDAEDAHLAALFQASFTREPDAHSQVLSIVRDTKAPADVVEARLPEFKQSWEAAQFATREASKFGFDGFRGDHQQTGDPFIDAARFWRKEHPELADLVRRRPELVPVVREIPGILRTLRAIRAETDALGPEAGQQTLDARVPTPRQHAAHEAYKAVMAQKTETVSVLEDEQAKEAQALTGIERMKIAAMAYGNGAKSRDYARLGSEAVFTVLAGGNIWDLEKKAAEMERDMVPRDYGAGPYEQMVLVDTPEIFSSQVGVMEGAGAGAVGGAVVGGAIGGVASRSLAGAKEGAKFGGKLGAKLGATAVSLDQETGGAFWDFKKLRTDAGEPLTNEEAAGAALIYGAAAAGIEGLSFGATEEQAKVALKALMGEAGFRQLAVRAFKAWAHKSLDEGLEEFSQTTAQDIVGYLAKSKHAGELQTADPISTVAQATDDFLKATVATALTGAPTTGFSVALAQTRRAQAVKAQKQIAVINGMADNPAVKAAPAAVGALIAAETKRTGAPVTSVFVEPTEFLRLFQGSRPEAEQAATELLGPDGPRLMQQALATGSRIEVPIGTYLEKWVSKPIAQAIAPHTTTTAFGETPAQVAQLEEAAKAVQEEWKKAQAAAGPEGTVPAASIGEAEALVTLEGQLATVQGKDNARRSLEPFRAVVRTMAAKFGVPADKLFAQYLVSAQAEGQTARAEPLVDPDLVSPAASVALRNLTKDWTPEQRAQLEHINQGSGLRESTVFDREPVPAGKQVAVFTSPTIKPINDDVKGGHGAADPLIDTIGRVLAENGHPEAARSGTNIAIHVSEGEDGDAELAHLHEAITAALPQGAPIAIAHGVGTSRETATKDLDAGVDLSRKEGILPERGAPVPGLDVGSLAFSPERVKNAQVPRDLIEAARKESHEEFFNRVLVEPATGLLSRKGRDILPRKKHQAMLDLRGLKKINDRFKKAGGNEFLAQFGSLIRDLGGSDFNAAHLSGDEYALEHDDPEALARYVDLLREVAHTVGASLRTPDGEVLSLPIEFRHGFGDTLENADRDLNQRKQAEGNGGAPAQDLGGRTGQPAGGNGDGLDPDQRRNDVASRRDALKRRARSQGFPGSRGTAFQEAVIAELRPQSLRDAEAWVGRLKEPERQAAASAWFRYAVGILRDRPTDVPADIKSELAKFGVVDPEGFDQAGPSIDPSMRRGKLKGGDEAASLKEYRLRSSMIPFTAETLRQPGWVREARFKKWFGDSKVVDAEGKPRVVYHGTRRSFDAFDPKKIGSNFAQDDRGFFFSADPEEGGAYAEGDGANVMPVYLSLQKPLVIDGALLKAEGMDPALAEDAIGFWDTYQNLIADWVKERGSDGVIVGDKLFVAFKPEQVKSATGNRGSFDPNDSNIVHQPPGSGDGTERGYTEFVQQGVDRIAKVVLRPNADLSTFLHESAHIFLDMFEQLASRPDAPARVREDLEATRKWMGLKEGERIQVEHHEKWADTFEGYLLQGKAPTSALRRVFHRFRLWLTAIYRGLSGISKTKHLSPEIQGVFDRLLATDEELEGAERRMGLSEPIWKSPAQFEGHAEEWAKYVALKEEAKANAQRLAEIRALKDRQRETESWWKEEEKALRDQLGDEYEQQPGRKAELILRGKEAPLAGESPLATMAKVPIPLDRAKVIAVVGEEGAKRFLTSKKNGMDPDEVSRMAGFETGEAMLKAVVAVPEKNAWVKETAAQRMREKYPDILQEREQLTATVEKALHSDFTAEALYRELQLLRKKAGALTEYREERLGTPPPPMEAIRRAAVQMVADTEVGKLTPGRALQAERAAADRALSHAAAGEFAQAAVAKQAQLLNMFLWRSLTDARDERDTLLDLAGDLRRDKSRARLGKANPAFRDGVDQVLESVNLRPLDPNPGERKTLEQAVQAMDEGGTSVLFELEPLQALIANPRDWKRLKVSEMRNLLAALRNIKTASAATTKAMLGDKHIAHEDAVTAILGEAAANRKERKPLASSTGAENVLQKAWNVIDAFGAGWIQPAVMIRWLGGNDPSSMTYRLLYQPLVDAYAKEADILKRVVEPITEAFKNIPEAVQARFTERIDGKALFPNHRHEKDIEPPSRRWELLVMALNAGNEENLKRLLEGRGITPEQLRAALDLLTKEEIDWVNTVGATFESLWPESKALEERLSGLAPPKVEGTPMQLKNGTIAGHYFPAVYDRRVENVVGERQAQNIGEMLTPGYVRPFTPHSHLKRRAQDFSGVIALDPSVIYAHLSQVAHDLAFREPVQSVGSLIMDPDVQAALKRHLSDEKAKVFLRWVQDVGTQRGAQVDSHLGTVNRFMRKLKSNQSVAVLGWSTRVMMGDWANLAANAIHIQPKFWWGGLKESMLDWEAADAEVMEKSAFMRARRGQVVHEFQNKLAAVTKSQAKPLKAMRWFKEHAFELVEWTDKVTSRPLWIGAYRQATAEGMGPEDAVRFADDKVMQAFPTTSPIFQAAWLRDRGTLGFITQFFGYFSTVYNMERDAVEQVLQAVGLKNTAKSAVKASAKLLAIWMVTGVLGELLTGRGPDKSDGDDAYERWFNWFKRQLALAPLRTVPLPIANTVESLALHKKPSVRAPPVFQLLEGLGRAAQLAMQDDKGDQALLQLAKTAGMTLGVPLSPFAIQAGYVAGVASGEITDPVDLALGPVHGPPRNR